MNTAAQELEQVSHRIAEAMYKTAAASGGAPGAAGAGGPGGATPGAESQGGPKKPAEGEVIDAEYVDVDESKRPN